MIQTYHEISDIRCTKFQNKRLSSRLDDVFVQYIETKC